MSELSAKSEETVKLSAESTRYPDGDPLRGALVDLSASTLHAARGRAFPSDMKLSANKGMATALVAPVGQKAEMVHVICEVKYSGHPALWSYRRAILHLQP